jgi:aldehyde dehydrogenase (NAD+)
MLHQNDIGGEWVQGVAAYLGINPPNLDDVEGDYASAHTSQTKAAIAAAHSFFSAWTASSPEARSNIPDRIGIKLLAQRDELGCLLSLEEEATSSERSIVAMVMGNLPTAGVDHHIPINGRKASSYVAREQGAYAHEFETAVKIAYTLG